MSVATGHKTIIAVGEQAAWGTAVARTAALRILEESLALKQAPIQKAVLGYSSQHIFVDGKRGVEGGIKTYLWQDGMEVWLKHCLGTKTTGAGVALDEAAGNYYTHTFTLGDLPQHGLSIEANRDAAAVGTAWLYDSMMVTKWSLEQKLEDGLIIGMEFLGRDEVKSAATGALTAPALKLFSWTNLVITLNGVEFDCEEFSVECENALDGDRNKFGTNLRKGVSKKEVRKVTGKLKGEMDGQTAYDLFRDQTEVELIATWEGRLLGEEDAAEVYSRLVVTLPRIKFSGETPGAKSAGKLELNLPFVANAIEDDDNTEIEIELVNMTA